MARELTTCTSVYHVGRGQYKFRDVIACPIVEDFSSVVLKGKQAGTSGFLPMADDVVKIAVPAIQVCSHSFFIPQALDFGG